MGRADQGADEGGGGDQVYFVLCDVGGGGGGEFHDALIFFFSLLFVPCPFLFFVFYRYFHFVRRLTLPL